MPKKSKPKQRTNWKQRALHCEEVIGVQKILAEAREERLEQCSKYHKVAADHLIEIALVADCQQGQNVLDSVKALKARAESAEKHNALLLEEREATEGRHPAVKKLTRSEYDHFVASCNAEAKPSQKLIDLMKSPETLASLPNQLFYPGKELSEKYRAGLNPTHWQRLKSWLVAWVFELVLTGAILCVLAGLVAFAYWTR